MEKDENSVHTSDHDDKLKLNSKRRKSKIFQIKPVKSKKSPEKFNDNSKLIK